MIRELLASVIVGFDVAKECSARRGAAMVFQLVLTLPAGFLGFEGNTGHIDFGWGSHAKLLVWFRLKTLNLRICQR